jgi:vacuolar-type H+-ATPase subunit F/Vma7
MHLVVVGGERAVRAFALAGIRGVVAEGREDLERVLDGLLREPDVGAIVVEPAVGALAVDTMMRLRKRREAPLVVELPTGEEKDGLDDMVRRTLGV